MVILLKCFQVSSGFEDQILESTKETPHVRLPWLTTLTSFLQNTGLRVKAGSLWKPRKQRDNEKALM